MGTDTNNEIAMTQTAEEWGVQRGTTALAVGLLRLFGWLWL